MRAWTIVGLSLLVGACAGEPEDTGSSPVIQEPVWPEVWEYQTFCWFQDENQCKLSGGEPVGDERVNCIDVEDTYDCVTDALNDLGDDGWLLDLPDRSFPDDAVVYLMYRPG